MSSDIDLEKKLDRLTVEDEIASHEMSIAQKKAIEKEAKAKYGRNWRKSLRIKVSDDTQHEMAVMGSELRGLSRTKMRRMR